MPDAAAINFHSRPKLGSQSVRLARTVTLVKTYASGSSTSAEKTSERKDCVCKKLVAYIGGMIHFLKLYGEGNG